MASKEIPLNWDVFVAKRRGLTRQVSPESLANFWSPRYPEQIPDRLVLADELRGNVIDLEGRELE